MTHPRVPRRALCAAAAALAALGAPSLASASPHPLPFSYPYETLPQEVLEAEQYVDLIPVRVPRELPDGTTEAVTSVRAELQTELEYGITDRLEVALYFAFRQGAVADAPQLRFQGLKQRLRYRFSDAGEWPVDVGVYVEIAEAHDEIELEEKLLLARRFGPVSVLANLWIEHEYYFQTRQTKHVYNPTLGATYELSPRASIGAEYWVRGRFNASPDAHYAGPALLLQGQKAWIAVAAYARLDALGGGVAVGDPFGRVWIRTVLGIDL